MSAGLRILVTGRDGQVAQALAAAGAARGMTIILAGRPELDLAHLDRVRAAILAGKPDVVVSAAAFTAVDKAESEPDVAMAVNAFGPGAVAAAAAELGAPVIHLSTDYVFDGAKTSPYVETDATGPTGVYGATKLAGEQAVAVSNADHAILRTAWVHGPVGVNFVKTMLRLGADREVLRVVADQVGNPTSSQSIADAVLDVAANLKDSQNTELRGVFHMSAAGEASWAEFAAEIFRLSAERGGPSARVEAIATADYPTPARRPANSRLDCGKLAAAHGVRLPDWRAALPSIIDRLLQGPASSGATS